MGTGAAIVAGMASSSLVKTPELLSPAGNWECARAAVANGADAIFFGLPAFNARMRADNFTLEDLPALMRYLHERGRKGYVTMNTLVFTGELEAAEEQLIACHEAGVDAMIVQDVGLVSLSRERVPGLAIHASTQMTLTSPEGLHFAQRLGIERAVVARELSLRELAKFRAESVLPLEVFVHGALCVAYSGQCLTSEMLGQRSANRGECAQACRLPYEMIVDGVLKDLGDRRYLLSPQDLAAIHEVPKLIELGIVSFKIEGRLKAPEYVAAVTQVYRKAIDASLEAVADGQTEAFEPDPADLYQLEMTFSRGLFSGWMHGVNHQELVHARFGKKRGPFVGFIEEVGKDHVAVKSQVPLAPGDGVVFDTGGDTNREQGGRLYEIRGNRLFFQHEKINFGVLKKGDRIWKTNDPQLDRRLQQSFVKEVAADKEAITVELSGREGEPLKARGVRLNGAAAEVSSEMLLQKALKRPLTEAVLTEQFGRLGDTTFELGKLVSNLEGEVMLPLSALNQVRRALVDALEMHAPEAPSEKPKEGNRLALTVRLAKLEQQKASAKPEEKTLSVLCRTLPQIGAALEAGVNEILVDFEDIRRYREAVELVRGSGKGAQVFLATPRIQKAGEQGFFKLIENAGPDGVLIRNLGALDYFRALPLRKIGDFSLNVANPLTAEIFMREGLERLTVSFDLNAGQVTDLLRAAPPGWFEIVVHQHMPMFHMEHCVFAAFLSTGTDYTNCGRPCDRHEVRLRDRVGIEHPVKADVGCRNTVFHHKPQSGASFLDPFVAEGAGRFRIDFLNEPVEQARGVIAAYQALLRGELDAGALVDRVRAVNQLGVTSGTLTVLG
jgi:putative protease